MTDKEIPTTSQKAREEYRLHTPQPMAKDSLLDEDAEDVWWCDREQIVFENLLANETLLDEDELGLFESYQKMKAGKEMQKSINAEESITTTTYDPEINTTDSNIFLDDKDLDIFDNFTKTDNLTEEPTEKDRLPLPINPDLDFAMEIFGMQWQFRGIKTYFKEKWVDLTGLVPCDGGDPVMFRINRVAEIRPHVNFLDEERKPMMKVMLGSTDENEVYVVPIEETKVIIGDMEADPKENMYLSSKYNLVDGKVTQGSNSVPNTDNGKTRKKKTSHQGYTAKSPKIRDENLPGLRILSYPGMKERDAAFRPNTEINGVVDPEMNLSYEKSLKANNNFFPHVIVQKDGELSSGTYTDIIPAVESCFRFVCEYCKVGFQQRYKLVNHIKIHMGPVVHKCSCEECGVPYRDYRTMRKHHNEAYKK